MATGGGTRWREDAQTDVPPELNAASIDGLRACVHLAARTCVGTASPAHFLAVRNGIPSDKQCAEETRIDFDGVAAFPLLSLLFINRTPRLHHQHRALDRGASDGGAGERVPAPGVDDIRRIGSGGGEAEEIVMVSHYLCSCSYARVFFHSFVDARLVWNGCRIIAA